MYLSWILLVACTIWICLLGFIWAVQDGQFSDQNRARYLPLAGEDDLGKTAAAGIPWKGRERYVYIGMAAMVLFFFGAAVFLGLTAGH